MNKVEKFLNILHFCFYLIFCKYSLFFLKINPLNLVFKIPLVKRRYEELRVEVFKNIKFVITDQKAGQSVGIIGGGLVGLLSIFLASFVNIFSQLVFDELRLLRFQFIISAILAAILCYYCVFKNDNYLKYFVEFGRWSKNKKIMYCIFSVLFIFFSISLFLFSLNIFQFSSVKKY